MRYLFLISLLSTSFALWADSPAPKKNSVTTCKPRSKYVKEGEVAMLRIIAKAENQVSFRVYIADAIHGRKDIDYDREEIEVSFENIRSFRNLFFERIQSETPIAMTESYYIYLDKGILGALDAYVVKKDDGLRKVLPKCEFNDNWFSRRIKR